MDYAPRITTLKQAITQTLGVTRINHVTRALLFHPPFQGFLCVEVSAVLLSVFLSWCIALLEQPLKHQLRSLARCQLMCRRNPFELQFLGSSALSCQTRYVYFRSELMGVTPSQLFRILSSRILFRELCYYGWGFGLVCLYFGKLGYTFFAFDNFFALLFSFLKKKMRGPTNKQTSQSITQGEWNIIVKYQHIPLHI